MIRIVITFRVRIITNIMPTRTALEQRNTLRVHLNDKAFAGLVVVTGDACDFWGRGVKGGGEVKIIQR